MGKIDTVIFFLKKWAIVNAVIANLVIANVVIANAVIANATVANAVIANAAIVNTVKKDGEDDRDYRSHGRGSGKAAGAL